MAHPPGTGPAAGHSDAGGLRVAHVRPLRRRTAGLSQNITPIPNGYLPGEWAEMCDPYGAGPPVSARTSRQYRTVTSLVNGPKHGAGPNNSNGSSRQSEREAVLNWFGEWAEPPRKLRFISRVGAAETALDNRSRMMFIHWWAAVCALAASLLAMLL